MAFGVVIIGELLFYILFSTEKFYLNRRKILAIVLHIRLKQYLGVFMDLFVLATK